MFSLCHHFEGNTKKCCFFGTNVYSQEEKEPSKNNITQWPWNVMESMTRWRYKWGTCVKSRHLINGLSQANRRSDGRLDQKIYTSRHTKHSRETLWLLAFFDSSFFQYIVFKFKLPLKHMRSVYVPFLTFISRVFCSTLFN